MSSLNITSISFINSSYVSDYFFIGADIIVDVNSEEISIQTGHSYKCGQYSLPSNSGSYYDEGSFLRAVDCLEFEGCIDEFNADHETDYTEDSLYTIKDEMNDEMIYFNAAVANFECIVDELFSNEDRLFVIGIKEYNHIYAKAFKDDNDRDNFLRENEDFESCCEARAYQAEGGSFCEELFTKAIEQFNAISI